MKASEDSGWSASLPVQTIIHFDMFKLITQHGSSGRSLGRSETRPHIKVITLLNLRCLFIIRPVQNQYSAHERQARTAWSMTRSIFRFRIHGVQYVQCTGNGKAGRRQCNMHHLHSHNQLYACVHRTFSQFHAQGLTGYDRVLVRSSRLATYLQSKEKRSPHSSS